jgi:hypothetical protein
MMPASANAVRTPHRTQGRNRVTQSTSPGMRGSKIRGPKTVTSTAAGALSPRNRGVEGRERPQQPILSQASSTWSGLVSTTSLPQRHILPAPRTVTPTSTTFMSWEDMDEGMYGTSQRNSRGVRHHVGDLLNECSPMTKSAHALDHPLASIECDDDMPMDEMAYAIKAVQWKEPQMIHQKVENVSPSISDPIEPLRRGRGLSASRSYENLVTPNDTRNKNSSKNRPPMPPSSGQEVVGIISPAAIEADDVSSLGATAISMDDRDVSTPMGRMMAALRQKSSHLPNLAPEERALWDCIQQSMTALRSENQARRRILERQLQDSTAKLDRTTMRETEVDSQRQDSKKRVVDLHQRMTLDSLGSPSEARGSEVEEQLREAQRLLQERQSEHESEVRAIQRVLADVTTEREEEVGELNAKVTELNSKLRTLQEKSKNLQPKVVQDKRGSPPLPPPLSPVVARDKSATSEEETALFKERAQEAELLEIKKSFKDAESDKVSLKKDLDKKTRRLIILERDIKVAKSQLSKIEEGKEIVERENCSLKLELECLRTASGVVSEDRESVLPAPPKPEQEKTNRSIPVVEVESLQKNLRETSSSLENAKKIIASLENANGSLAVDLRAKLKAKEEELAVIQSESNDRKRHLDSLATELRDLQRKQGDEQRTEQQGRAQILRFKVLSSQLAQTISELQSASVVHEVSAATGTPDVTNVEHVAELLGDTLIALKTTMETTDEYIDGHDDQSAIGGTDVDTVVNSEVGRQVDALIQKDREAAAKDLRQELEQKKVAVKRLEEALKRQNEEMKRLRTQVDTKGRGSEETNQKLLTEIQSLREQCTTNMEVLAKKERELSVLRSSLKVDDDDGGYISDDVSDGEEDSNPVQASPARLNGYGRSQSQTEALVTLLSHTGTGIHVPSRAQELDVIKSELSKKRAELERSAKDLQEERESLANAKMIISSLEKANKSMMEDLRSRLQDSNTAIASLLDKSVENEKTTACLQEEVEKLQKERDEEKKKFEEEVRKFKDQAALSDVRNLDGFPESTDKVGKPPGLEEKKDDPVDEEKSADFFLSNSGSVAAAIV